MAIKKIEIHPAEAQRRIRNMINELIEARKSNLAGGPGTEIYWNQAALEFAYETIKEVRKLYADKESSR